LSRTDSAWQSRREGGMGNRPGTNGRGMLSALALLIAACVGCAPLAILPPEPLSEASSAEPKPAISYVALPLTVSSASLASELDRRLSDQVGDKGIFFAENVRTPIRGAKVQFGVHRSGPASVSAVEGQLTYRVPLAINSGKYDWYRCGRILGCRTARGEFGGAGIVSGKTDVGINEDWKLVSKTRFGFSWVEGPWIDSNAHGEPARIDLHPLIDLLAGWKVRKVLQEYAERVDDRLSKLEIRPYIEAAWRRVHQPVQLASNPPIWLTVAPLSLGVGQPRSEGSDLQFTPTLVATLRGQVGERPSEIEGVPSLPKNLGHSESDQIEIQLPVLVEYKYLNAVLGERVIGRTFTFRNGAQVTIRDARISATGDHLVARVDFDADGIPGRLSSSASGTVYLTGRLVYDNRSCQLSVRDFDYELATKDYLEQVADWLIHDAFVQRMQERLVFDVSRAIRPVRDRAEKGFTGVELLKGMMLTASVQELLVDPDAVVSEKGISILIKIRGSARVDVAIPQGLLR
jgi:uncharacterized protein DUF4403